jgi:hypothetical protein
LAGKSTKTPDSLAADLPEWKEQNIDLAHWYLATLAVYLSDGPSNSTWKNWNKAIKAALLDKASRDRASCAHGSWPPVGRWAGSGGRVVSTALVVLSMEVYYQYEPASTDFGSRFGGKRFTVMKGGGGIETEEAVLGGLRWLARHQGEDGSWASPRCGTVPRFAGECEGPLCREIDADSATALATLAFVGAGYTQLSMDTYDGIVMGQVVKKALQYMVGRQRPDGRLSPRPLAHILSTLALAETFALTKQIDHEAPVERALGALLNTPPAEPLARGWAAIVFWLGERHLKIEPERCREALTRLGQ